MPRPKLTQEEVERRCKKHGLQLLDVYSHSNTKVSIKTIKCGHIKRILPCTIGRRGCKQCFDKRIGQRCRLTQVEAIRRMREKGIEPLEPYINIHTSILVLRTECNHKWKARPGNIFRNHSCPRCAKYGFQINKPAMLYYVKLHNSFGDPIYKIGVTNRSIRERFINDFHKITIIEKWYFENGAEALEMEQDILTDFDADRYIGPDILDRGNGEVFNLDVLALDRSKL